LTSSGTWINSEPINSPVGVGGSSTKGFGVMVLIPNRLMWCTSYSDRFRETCGLTCNWTCDYCQQPICDEHKHVDEAGRRICPNCLRLSRAASA
jgi:hypothetical protein